MSCCIKRQLFIRKLDIRTVYVKEIEIFREISLFFLSFFALVEKGDVQMKQYIGIKVVAARPMTRGDYNIFRGWQIPADEDPADNSYWYGKFRLQRMFSGRVQAAQNSL